MLNQKNTLALSILLITLGLTACQKPDSKKVESAVDQTAASQVPDTSLLLQGDRAKLKLNLPEYKVIDQAILDNLDKMLDIAQLSKKVADQQQASSQASASEVNTDKTPTQQLQDRVQPYTNSFLALDKELKTLGASGQITISLSPKILNSDKPLATVVLNSSSYLGGAHGSSAQTYFNFDLVSKKQVNLNQIIEANQKAKFEKLAHDAFKVWVIDSKLADNVNEYEQAWKFQLSDNFYLGKQGLILQYGEYDIGPYVVGLPRLTIPYDQLKVSFSRLIQTQHALNQLKNAPRSHLAPGLHPFYIEQHDLTHLNALEQILQTEQCIAVGEIGLDTFLKQHKQPEILDKQKAFFSAQIELAQQFDLPILLHIRKSHADVLTMLKQHQFQNGGIAHAFSGGVEEAKALIKLGFKIGVTGQITQPNAKKLHAVVQGHLKQAQSELGDLSKLPKSLKVLLENLLRFEDDLTVKRSDIQAIVDWQKAKTSDQEIQYRPARVLMQDFTGVPAVVDLAAMRAAVQAAHKDPNIINPLSPVDLVIDHSVMVDHFGTDQAFDENVEIEMQRNGERYQFLRWGQSSFDNFSVVPPGTGICHQVNLEYLAQAVWLGDSDGESYAFPDTLGIEAEAAMLGQPISMLIPEVIGFKLTGKLREGITATDLVLTITQMLRKKGVVGKFVEFYGDGLADLPLADRATIANMAPEYGATCDDRIALVEAYCKEQGLWRNTGDEPVFTDTLALDMNTVEASVAGPKRPQDRVVLPDIPKTFSALMELDLKPAKIEKERLVNEGGAGTAIDSKQSALQNEEPHCVIDGKRYPLTDGDVVISAITSSKKAIEKGLQRKPWVKSSLAPGSKVVTDYLEAAGLLSYLDQLGYNLVGYGCTTCIGNRNFEGRVHPLVKTNWLASPPLVVAFGLLGTIRSDITSTALGHDQQGQPVYLKDIWPSQIEIDEVLQKVNTQMFHKEYAAVFDGDEKWQAIQIPDSETYEWDEQSTYIRHPPFFEGIDQPAKPIQDILNANILAVLGDSVTTDHISPAGNIKKDSPAGRYLEAQGVDQKDFNSYGSRRGNHEVMMRGTFANIRIKNEMLNGKEYGTGSSRDWAAKGTNLLGVKAVITESFERIHRSNLVGMGVLPLQFVDGQTRQSLNLTGHEQLSIYGLSDDIQPHQTLDVEVKRADGSQDRFKVLCRIDTLNEVEYFKAGGILHYVLRNLIAS
ncbi:hypothetical protein FQR65_LT19352 [Abscondita terminalis]|nr:hypothetical protein FQR65_LT19352 [Abscondita terminalis]